MGRTAANDGKHCEAVTDPAGRPRMRTILIADSSHWTAAQFGEIKYEVERLQALEERNFELKRQLAGKTRELAALREFLHEKDGAFDLRTFSRDDGQRSPPPDGKAATD
jgi:hypothetical protein